MHGFSHAVPGTWHAMGLVLSAAGSLRWFRDTLTADRSYAELEALATASRAGASGLVFLPYLTGERTPHPDATARGAFVGLTVRHGLGDLTRAVLEGVAFGLRDSVELLRGMLELREIRVAGGGAQSGLWVQLLADILDRPVQVVGGVEAAAHGAAIVRVGPPVQPTAAAEAYREPYAIYRSLYPEVRTTFGRLAAQDA